MLVAAADGEDVTKRVRLVLTKKDPINNAVPVREAHVTSNGKCSRELSLAYIAFANSIPC